MKRIFPILSFLLLQPLFVLAQEVPDLSVTSNPVGLSAAERTVTMRSGDHARFARLVLAIPVGSDWRIGRSGRDYVLDLGNPAVRYDPSGVFDRITRRRLVDLEQLDGRLGLILGCECHVSAFLWRPDRLVIDVREGDPAPGSPFEAALDARPSDSDVRPVMPAGMLPSPFRLPRAVPPEVSLPDPFEGAVERERRLADMEASILESFARAATHGVLEINRPDVPTAMGHQLPGVEPLPAMTIPETGPSDRGAPPRPGVTMQTSIERDRPTAPLVPITQSGSNCLPDQYFDLASWGDGTDFRSQIATRNAALANEFDRLPAPAIEALARTYLHFGFGREALSVLTLDNTRSLERDIISVLARLVDGEPVPSGILDDQSGCTTAVALWRVMARGSVAGTSAAERTAILTNYRLLPDTLRGHVGNRLAALFVAAGDPATADALLSAAVPATTGTGVEGRLSQAEVALQTGGPEAAIAQLDEIAATDARMTPEGLLRLMELNITERREVEEDLLVLAATLRFENRDQPIAAALAGAEVEVLLQSGRFDEAFMLLNGEIGPMEPAAKDELTTRIVRAAVDAMPDMPFLAMAFAPLPPGVDAAATNAVASRLVALGFADRSLQLLDLDARGPAGQERRLIRAESLAALGRDSDAEKELRGIADPRAVALRTDLLARRGEYQAALAAMSADESAASADLLWRAGAWDQLGETEDPLLRDVSAAVRSDVSALSEEQPLAERRALLEGSAATRDLTERLLQRFNLTDEGIGP